VQAVDSALEARETAAKYEIRLLAISGELRLAQCLLWQGDWAAAYDAAQNAVVDSRTLNECRSASRTHVADRQAQPRDGDPRDRRMRKISLDGINWSTGDFEFWMWELGCLKASAPPQPPITSNKSSSTKAFACHAAEHERPVPLPPDARSHQPHLGQRDPN
jgi:hypothetical protein